jgi:exodeoxyribonuclease VII small subunit
MVDTETSRSVDTSSVGTLSFEEALAELQAIVESLEKGQGKLEEAVTQYERGAALRQHCETLLAQAEQKVQAIVEAASGPTLRDAG